MGDAELVDGWVRSAPYVVPAVAALVPATQLYAWYAMLAFARRHASIDSVPILATYQRLVAVMMILALVVLTLGLVAPMLYFSALAVGANMSVLGLSPMIAWLSFGKNVRDAELKLRSLPVVEPLQDAYTATNRVWIDRAFPRFAPLPTTRTTATESQIECDVHGYSPGGRCERCRAIHCRTCVQHLNGPATLCGSCLAHYRDRVRDLLPSYRANFSAATLMSALGISDALVGFMFLGDPEMNGIYLVVLGALTMVAGMLWGVYYPPARTMALVLGVPHLLLPPVGTAIALGAGWVAHRHADALTAEATAAALASGTNRTEGFRWIVNLGRLSVIVHGVVLVTIMVFGGPVFARVIDYITGQ